jgi:hypothetical protein
MIKANSKTRIKKILLTLCFFLCITSVVGQGEPTFEEDVIDNSEPLPIDEYIPSLIFLMLIYSAYKISKNKCS